MPRCFLAIPLPPRLRKRLGEEADRLRLSGAPVAWTKPDLYHVTVRFLGEIEDAAQMELLPAIEGLLSASEPLRLVARGLGAFPAGDRPRVVWCGVEGEDDRDRENLLRLRLSLNDGLARAGCRREKGPFLPHVTLGRLRSAEGAEGLLERMGPARIREFGHFEATRIVLYESLEGPRGREYHALQTFGL